MPQLNEEKLDKMVEAVINSYNLIRHLPFENACSHYIDPITLREALIPFCMELTDEEIEEIAAIRLVNYKQEESFIKGAKFVRDGK